MVFSAAYATLLVPLATQGRALLGGLHRIGQVTDIELSGCEREGAQPSLACLSWGSDECYFSESDTPVQSLEAVRKGVQGTSFLECNDNVTNDCINVTHSARVHAAAACAAMYEGLENLVMAEMSSLPPGQLRYIDGWVEFNIPAQLSINASTTRTLQEVDLICSDKFTHTCKSEGTGYVFDSKFEIQIGSGAVISKDWRQSPEAAVTMKVGELAMWEATCSRSLWSVMKVHMFTAGGNSLIQKEQTMDQSVKTVYPRCVVSTTFDWT